MTSSEIETATILPVARLSNNGRTLRRVRNLKRKSKRRVGKKIEKEIKKCNEDGRDKKNNERNEKQ
jgi:uncharacterized OB-fold protein